MFKSTKNTIEIAKQSTPSNQRRKQLKAIFAYIFLPFSRYLPAETTNTTKSIDLNLDQNKLVGSNEKLNLTNVKLSNFLHEQQTFPRISLISNGKLNFDYLLLAQPTRLVLDLKNITWNEDLSKKLPIINEQDNLIKSLRVARYKPEIIRFVAELKNDAQLIIYQDLNNKSIIHLDLATINVAQLPIRRADEIRLISLGNTYPTKETIDSLNNNSTTTNNPLNSNSTNNSIANKQISKSTVEDKSSNDNQDEDRISTKRYGRSSRLIIAIDAGHGGIDPGAVGREGTKEKNITLALAQLLESRLEKEHPVKVVLTRHNDNFVALSDRVLRARKARAELFISLHADAWIKPDARGSSVFVLSEKAASSSAARWLAKIQNEVDVLGGVNIAIRDQTLAKTILDLSQSASKFDSMRFAKLVIKEVAKINRLHRGFVEYANFAVLKAPDIPSILFETAFISNPEEEQLLRDDTHREKICNALSNGIEAYFSKNTSRHF